MKKKWIKVMAGVILIAGAAAGAFSFADFDDDEIHKGTIHIHKQAETEYPSLAKITLEPAVNYALKAVGGQILKAELENENGFLVYGIEIVTPEKNIMKVMVDAGSGEILGIEKDMPDKDDDEAIDESQES